jgi:hypothetical protein
MGRRQGRQVEKGEGRCQVNFTTLEKWIRLTIEALALAQVV